MDDTSEIAGPLITPAGSALQPQVALATSLHASPGVYALLLGSGVSTGAGIETGWGIVTDLVRRAAAAQDPSVLEAGETAAADPEAWWAEHGDGELGYSTLLAAVAPNAAARQAVLAQYFEVDEAAREAGEKVPSAAHRAAAQLVLRGTVRVILTTNFDRLTERALEDVGISPQVIHRPDQFDGATPLTHSRATVIKLHGDYLDLESRNTVDELDAYPSEQARFLDRVLDEYGLVVCGWSADWDHALVRAIEGTRSRRYPLFWSHLGSLGESARRLTARHTATLIPGMTADEFFPDLIRRLEALDRLADAPVTREMAVVRLKRALPDALRRIELFDLVDQTTSQLLDRATAENYPLNGDVFPDSVRAYRADCDTLLHLLATGVFHDDGRHDDLWVRTVQRLTRTRESVPGQYRQGLEALRHYPALLAVWTMGVAAILARREYFLARLFMEPGFRSPFNSRQQKKPTYYLNPADVLGDSGIHEVTRADNGGKWVHPQSPLLRSEGREPLRLIEPDDAAYEAACDRFEFLVSLIALGQGDQPWPGMYLFESRWGYDGNGLAAAIAQEISPNWPLIKAGAFKDVESAEAAYKNLAELRNRNGRYL
ncbi:SIR2 family protein [Streptomyces sp. R08]|uniref:SIR2 family protein n=1 Tax=Streptomyces sp. R08 TaxID=3238624 RepID=A0AB39M1R7_9ACTN